MKKTWKNIMGKASVATTGIVLGLGSTVTQAAGTAPSTYVNKISTSLLGEIMKMAPKVVVVVVAWAVFMYFCSGDEHKKSKFKSTAIVGVVAFAVLLVLPQLIGWLDGLI